MQSKKWFVIYIAVVCVLFLSWLLPPTKYVWEAIDTQTFLLLNSSLEGSPYAQIFWALANYRPVDIFGAIFMTLFFVMHILDGETKDERIHRVSQLIYALAWGEIGILLTKQCIGPFIENIEYFRESPSLIFPHVVSLSRTIPWLTIKDCSPSCFPGDHAEIVLQWVAFITFYCGWKKGSLAFLWSLLFILPRLVAGAHWLSDALVGSVCIVLIIMAFATRTALYTLGINFITRYLHLWTQKKELAGTT